jgi:dipeptidyl aminopeptidase/acylaminoacyl peptidase
VWIGGIPSAPGQYTAGFVSLPSGTLTVDRNANVSGMPHEPGQPSNPEFYSASLSRWIPLPAPWASPDGRQYVYEQLVPDGATLQNSTADELHLYDVGTGADRLLWTYTGGSIGVIAWDSDGVIVQALPKTDGGTASDWVVDPSRGGAVPSRSATDPTLQAPSNAGSVGSWSFVGSDSNDDRLYWEGSNDGNQYEVVLVQADGQSTTVYSGVHNDTAGLDPFMPYFDTADLVWFPDFNGQSIWSWSRTAGLQNYAISGLPAFSAGYPATGYFHAHRLIRPAGACLSA